MTFHRLINTRWMCHSYYMYNHKIRIAGDRNNWLTTTFWPLGVKNQNINKENSDISIKFLSSSLIKYQTLLGFA